MALLTQADRDTLVRAVLSPDDDCAHNFAPLFEAVEHMFANHLTAATPAPKDTP